MTFSETSVDLYRGFAEADLHTLLTVSRMLSAAEHPFGL